MLLLGESQGGHIAARLCELEEPDLLILLASVPDVAQVDSLRKAGTATVIGWKARCLSFS